MNRAAIPPFFSLSLVTVSVLALQLSTIREAVAADTGTIRGVVTNSKTGEPVPDALVILQCNCLTAAVETVTAANGVYGAYDLPAGRYTVQVLSGSQNLSKVVTLQSAQKTNLNFSANPGSSEIIEIEVEATAVAQDTASGVKVSVKEVQNIPVGNSQNRDFSDVVLMSPTATKSAGGISVAGTTAAETKYTLEGASVNNPTTGTVGVQVVQEYIQSVEVKEAGYDAEFGGASGGQVIARRKVGTNEFKGSVRFTVTPRLRPPKVVISSDDSVRGLQTQDIQGQFAAVLSGPIIKDKLFFSAYVAPEATKNTLRQSFYHRVDRDNSGGFRGCDYERGANDCAPGLGFIQTQEFHSDSYTTGVVSGGWALGLDWQIKKDHKLGLTVRGGPSYERVTYRLPLGSGSGVGQALAGVSPGATVGITGMASGVIDKHFGWNRSNNTTSTLRYEGRALNDKMEIEGLVSYFRNSSQQAWKLDHPWIRDVPGSQADDDEGANLYDLIGLDRRAGDVPGLDQWCNEYENADGVYVPDIACPVRTWLSGGLGPSFYDRSQAIEGQLRAAHFFKLLGEHQIKYGAEFQWLSRRLISSYSGSNSSDYNDNCADGSVGGGEWCFDPTSKDDPATRGYQLFRSQDIDGRVNNHRFIMYRTDNPEEISTIGYGRARKEHQDLRALTSAVGSGVRVDNYDETLSTTNYAAYLQEKWSILSNLYVGAGVRWQGQTMKDIFGKTQIAMLDNVAPRLSAFYDWTGVGKSRLYGSYGWFFNPMPLNLNSRVFGGLINVNRRFKRSQCEDSLTAQGKKRWNKGQPTEWCADNPVLGGTTGTTTGTVVPRLKGPYNAQFQVGYQQELFPDFTMGVRWLHTNVGRAIEDVSTDGGVNFLIANPGEAVAQSDLAKADADCAALESQFSDLIAGDPDAKQGATGDMARRVTQCRFATSAFRRVNTLFGKPQRNYDAWTLEVKKAFGNNWMLIGSYTYSRLYGNYDGMVDPTTGAVSVGSSTQFDVPEIVLNSYGPLFGDIPHRVNLDAFYTFDFGNNGKFTVGTSFRYRSGAAISIKARNARYAQGFQTYLLPRGAGGRLRPNHEINLSVSYAYVLPKDMTLEVAGRILNATNRLAPLLVDNTYSRSTARAIVGGTKEDLYHARAQAGSSSSDYFNKDIVAPQGNFAAPIAYQAPMAAQIDLRLNF